MTRAKNIPGISLTMEAATDNSYNIQIEELSSPRFAFTGIKTTTIRI